MTATRQVWQPRLGRDLSRAGNHVEVRAIERVLAAYVAGHST